MAHRLSVFSLSLTLPTKAYLQRKTLLFRKETSSCRRNSCLQKTLLYAEALFFLQKTTTISWHNKQGPARATLQTVKCCYVWAEYSMTTTSFFIAALLAISVSVTKATGLSSFFSPNKFFGLHNVTIPSLPLPLPLPLPLTFDRAFVLLLCHGQKTYAIPLVHLMRLLKATPTTATAVLPTHNSRRWDWGDCRSVMWSASTATSPRQGTTRVPWPAERQCCNLTA